MPRKFKMFVMVKSAERRVSMLEKVSLVPLHLNMSFEVY